MKSIIISSNKSGGGKTTVTLGLMKALMKKGYKIQGYKIGPDYIDTAFHSHITRNPSRNLDLYLMNEDGVKESFSRGQGDLGIIEGVMGLYDGKGIDTSYSTAHVAKVLNVPVVLVLSPKAQSATLCAEIKGIMEYENINIAGVIFNNVSEGYYKLLKILVEENCSLTVFGYVPKDERIKIGSRHLGLVQQSEIEDLDKKIDICSELILSYINLDLLVEKFQEVKETKINEKKFVLSDKKLNIAVAYDKAFSFYYRENIEALKSLGKVQYISPLKDKKLPENIDFLYLGGGYPEVFIKEITKNKSMMESIKKSLDNGLHCYAECGGLMYLTEGIEDLEGNFYKTVGFFKGKSYMTKRLQNFGYSTVCVEEENNILSKGLKINCHEFHKSYVDLEEKTIYKLKKARYDGIVKEWKGGYIKNNTLGAYAHVHFLGNMEFVKNLISRK